MPDNDNYFLQLMNQTVVSKLKTYYLSKTWECLGSINCNYQRVKQGTKNSDQKRTLKDKGDSM